MAVEIPVYVNITQGINNAVAQIPKEMPKLQRAVSNNVLNIPIYWSGRGFTNVRDALINTTASSKELRQILQDIRYQFDKASQNEANITRTSAKVKNLAQAYGLVEQRLTGVYNKNTTAMLMVQNTITKVQAKIAALKTTLAGLKVGSDAFNDVNYQIKVQEQRLGTLTKQMMSYKVAAAGVNAEMRTQSGILQRLTAQFGAYMSVFALIRFVKQIRDVTGELEYQRVALGHLIQDEEYGAQLFERIKEAAKESPFRITQLVTYTKQLAAYRIEQENLFDTTKRLADISAGLGVDMNRLILAYGQVRAASVLRGQELRQFTEAGIPLVELLADKFSELKGTMVSTADVFKLISERAVPFSMISEIFEDLTEKGGQFYNMQEKQAATLKGRWEKLKDAYDIALQGIGENDTFQKWNNTVLGILNGISKNLRGIIRLVNALSIAWVSYKIVTSQVIVGTTRLTRAFIKEYGAVTTLKFGLELLKSSFKKLIAIMSSNWVGLVLSAVAGLVTYFTTFRKKTEEVTGGLNEMEAAIEKMSQANKEFSRTETLIKRYEKLSSETKRTADENLKLANTMDRLKETFPEISKAIGDENLALDEQIKLLNEANSARKEQARDEAKNELDLRQKQYEDLSAQVEAARAKYEQEYEKYANLKSSPTQAFDPKTGLELKDYSKALSEAISQADQAALSAKNNLDELREQAGDLLKKITRLKDVIDPTAIQKDWAEWQNQVKSTQDEFIKMGDTPVFTSEDISNMNSVYDLFKKLKKRVQDLEESLKGMNTALAQMGEGDAKNNLQSEIDSVDLTLKAAKAIQALFGFDFSPKHGSGYKKDAFITLMENRIKFMKDFKKGYDDLSKYMSENNALLKEGDIMQGRGLSLRMNLDEQKRAAKDLSQWYQDQIDAVVNEMAKKGFKAQSVTEILSQEFVGEGNKSKMLRDYQALLQSLWDAKTDYDTSQAKTDLENALKRLSDEIKRSEVARNFYNNILDLTGDEELAATMSVSVYGGIGEEFKQRMQKQLNEALDSLDADEKGEMEQKLIDAFDAGNYSFLIKNLDAIPEKIRSVVKQVAEDSEKYNADWVLDIMKTYQKAKTFEERISDVRRREAQKRKEIAENETLSKGQKDTYTAASLKKEGEDIAAIQVEALKDTYEWGKAFEDLDRVGFQTLKRLREKIIELIEAQKGFLTPEQLKTLRQELEKLNSEVAERDPMDAIGSGFKKASLIAPLLNSKEGTKAYARAAEKIREFNAAARETEKIDIDHLEDEFMDANKTIEEGIDGVSKYVSAWKDVVDTITDAFNLDEVPVLGETLEGVSDSLSFVATILPVIITLNKILNGVLMLNPIIAIGAAIVATIGAIVGLIKGIVNAKIEKLNKKIEEQKILLEELEHSYDRLDKAIEKAFGSDYILNYNKQLENLYAQQEAYQKQAELERKKGKKADEEKIRDYENSARDAAEAISDMSHQLSEFFADTDITSAASDFADSWIEAYKEFGSTSDAMKEKFNDLIESMITQSLGAKIMQSILRPLFQQIDEMSAEGGELSAQEIANIANMAPEYIGKINDAMNTLMGQLIASGYNLRQQAGSFTGISRNIATASEESINGLAAGINTQNFYMSHIDMNVAAILSALTGGTTTEGSGRTGEYVDPYKDQMLLYVSSLPQMRDDIASLRAMWEKVIRPVGMSATHYVSTNM